MFHGVAKMSDCAHKVKKERTVLKKRNSGQALGFYFQIVFYVIQTAQKMYDRCKG